MRLFTLACVSDNQDGVLVFLLLCAQSQTSTNIPWYVVWLLQSTKQYLTWQQINFAGRPFYMIGILGFKVALCCAYLRILEASPNPHYKILIYVAMVGAIIGHVVGTFILLFQCSPVRRSWRPSTPGHCLPNDATFYGLAAVTIVFDVVIFLLPIPLLVKLNINVKKKIVLVCVFLLGLLTTVCSIMRMIQIIAIAETGDSTMLVVWGVIELNVGVSCRPPLPRPSATLTLNDQQIILTCIPTLGPLFPSLTGGTSLGTPSQDAYRLNAIRAHKGAPQAGNAKATPLGGTTMANSTNGSSSEEEILGLKTSEAAMYGIRDDDILKTTEVRVSIDDPERAASRVQTARAW